MFEIGHLCNFHVNTRERIVEMIYFIGKSVYFK
jgi:hypothetical protein